MNWISALRARLSISSRSGAEERMEEEMRFHIEKETEKHIRAGVDPAEAKRRAM